MFNLIVLTQDTTEEDSFIIFDLDVKSACDLEDLYEDKQIKILNQSEHVILEKGFQNVVISPERKEAIINFSRNLTDTEKALMKKQLN